MSVVLEVEKLIIPLGDDSYCVFHEGAYDEEAPSCWYVPTASKSPISKRSLLYPRHMHSGNMKPSLPTFPEGTHCFIGSAAVSNHSSILFVCSLSCSSGLGSFVASALPGPPNLLSCEPRL